MKEFQESQECQSLSVARNDLLSVRVPVTILGSTIFWQFSTVDYDISFAVSYQEGKDAADESSEAGPLTELLSPRRVDSHLNVVCGSHKPDALGHYLLRFDNTFSYWRSKTVLFHVYCTTP